MFFTALTALSFISFTNQHELGPSHAFGGLWWFWLAATGLSLGATLSVKWVGLFTVAWVGTLTVLQLWVLLGDTRTVTPVGTVIHFCAGKADYKLFSVCGLSTSFPGSSALLSSQLGFTVECLPFISCAW